MIYPHFEALDTAPDYLWIGAAAMHALNGTIPPSARVMPEQPDKEATRAQVERHRRAQGAQPRRYASRYVGVTVHRRRWVAQWGKHGAHTGHKRPLTDEGEVAAAWEYARVMGRPGIEERPAAQVKPRNEAHELPAHEERGAFKTRLGGKRIG